MPNSITDGEHLKALKACHILVSRFVAHFYVLSCILKQTHNPILIKMHTQRAGN